MNTALKYIGITLLVGGIAYFTYNHFYHTQEPMKRITEQSGLSYEILTPAPADAQSPQKGQAVSVHYTGWIDENGQPGRKFDSSVDRGQQFQFPLGQGYVIAGWDEAVAGMKIGEKRRVFIPANLGYGARGAGAAIPPHANLIFDIELFGAQ
jgi:peptidylprolyl isomerase